MYDESVKTDCQAHIAKLAREKAATLLGKRQTEVLKTNTTTTNTERSPSMEFVMSSVFLWLLLGLVSGIMCPILVYAAHHTGVPAQGFSMFGAFFCALPCSAMMFLAAFQDYSRHKLQPMSLWEKLLPQPQATVITPTLSGWRIASAKVGYSEKPVRLSEVIEVTEYENTYLGEDGKLYQRYVDEFWERSNTSSQEGSVSELAASSYNTLDYMYFLENDGTPTRVVKRLLKNDCTYWGQGLVEALQAL